MFNVYLGDCMVGRWMPHAFRDIVHIYPCIMQVGGKRVTTPCTGRTDGLIPVQIASWHILMIRSFTFEFSCMVYLRRSSSVSCSYMGKPDRPESESAATSLKHIVRRMMNYYLEPSILLREVSFDWSGKPCHCLINSNYRKSIVRHQPYWSLYCTGTGQGKVPMNNVRVSLYLPTSVRGISSRQKRL